MAAYLVTTPTEKRLIEARTGAAAINYVIRDTVTAKTLNTKELIGFINEGMKIETVKAEEKAKA